jgi:hypothetical protein
MAQQSKPKLETGKLYLINWLDASEQEAASEKRFGAVVQTVGWVVKKSRLGIRLGCERYRSDNDSEEHTYRGITDIPKSLIVEAVAL